MSFSLYGKCCAFSRNHLDPEGVVSVIQIETGTKLWAIRCQGPNGETSVPNLKSAKMWSSSKWDVAFLEPGDAM